MRRPLDPSPRAGSCWHKELKYEMQIDEDGVERGPGYWVVWGGVRNDFNLEFSRDPLADVHFLIW